MIYRSALTVVLFVVALATGCSSHQTGTRGALAPHNPALLPGTRDLGLQETAWGLRRVIATMRASRRTIPNLPRDGVRSGTRGHVVAEILIGQDGVPQNAAVAESSGHPEIDVAIAAALLDWRYYPWIENGQPIEIVTRETVVFDMRATSEPKSINVP